MLKKIFVSLIFSFVVPVLICNFSLAQSDVDVDLTTGGSAKCTFSGKVPFRSIKAANNNLVVDSETGTTEVSINSELDTEKSTVNADIFASIEVISNPLELLNGEIVEFESTLKTIQTLEEDIEADENGRVIVTCKFKDVPVNFSGDSGFPF
jgi:hypothetical protein